jgi:predicted nuclease of predicted toxin-antitoxin system
VKFKLDENLGAWAVEMLVAAGHDVSTVVAQGMSGGSDRPLAEHCARESRCLVTLDKEFANPFVYPPADFAGIILLRYPDRGGRSTLAPGVQTLIQALDLASTQRKLDSLAGKLWVVHRGAVREYAPLRTDDDIDSI